ncbi:MAG: succinate dehydrogenase [Granulosicoccus sp.]|nr:succinate dehydrogenase [Granulosicoccus sp.]
MAPFVIVHIIVMIVATQGGLTAAEILGRTQGSLVWLLFYGAFVFIAAVHAAIGLRVILHEWLSIKGYMLNLISLCIGTILILMGIKAVMSVTGIPL